MERIGKIGLFLMKIDLKDGDMIKFNSNDICRLFNDNHITLISGIPPQQLKHLNCNLLSRMRMVYVLFIYMNYKSK